MTVQPATTSRTFAVRDYNLSATLGSGQSFRWRETEQGWAGVIGRHWVRLRSDKATIEAITAEAVTDWHWLTDYLQLEVSLADIIRTFPADEPMRAALAACRGLRLLRQDPWECLASFILSSTKQIVQIQQIIALLSERFGEPLVVGPGHTPAFAFPTPERLARCAEADLRACKMGFRAPYLLETARAVAGAQFDLRKLAGLPVDIARSELMKLHGVGRKIADCVLLFA
jgi:N-glycosylase/DNA lyase